MGCSIKVKVVSDSSCYEYDLCSDSNVVHLKNLSSIKDFPIEFCCNMHCCGSCLVKVLEGQEFLNPADSKEQQFLQSVGAYPNERLLCRCFTASNISIAAVLKAQD